MIIKCNLSVLLSLLALALTQTFSQTPGELKQKYGAPITEVYLMRPGIMLVVSYAVDNQACEMLIEPVHSVLADRPADILMSQSSVSAIIAELAPLERRGSLIRRVNLSSGCTSTDSEDYEQVVINRTINTCNAKDDKKGVMASIRWKTRICRQK
jgi:hypothetical protein